MSGGGTAAGSAGHTDMMGTGRHRLGERKDSGEGGGGGDICGDSGGGGGSDRRGIIVN